MKYLFILLWTLWAVLTILSDMCVLLRDLGTAAGEEDTVITWNGKENDGQIL